ncbi:MAG TPA: citrate/2-methylcitrate synthase [Candidatus Obscuribacterales bacterium]
MSAKTMSAAEACEALGIQPATLYAYVSRGLIRSQARPDSRAKVYLVADVERLRQKKSLRHSPESGALHALDWGLPVLESSVSRITGGSLFYRSHPLEGLLGCEIEDLVRLLWQQPDWKPSAQAWPAFDAADSGTFERLQLGLLWAGTRDLRGFDLSQAGILASSGRILAGFFAEIAGRQAGDLLGHFAGLDRLRRELLRRLLIVCADHELNTSTFTARCVASARATPYAAVSAGLAALAGRRHGGSTRRTEALFRVCEQAPSVNAGLRQWLQQEPDLPGCGHRLYPEGDPRWQALEAQLLRDFGDHPVWLQARAIAEAYAELELPAPNIDFGLAIVARILAWPAEAPTEALVWFALGRVIGWLAHIQEQYGQEAQIRPRARHT